jgi:integrase
MARNYGEGSVYRDGDGWKAAITINGKRKVVRAKTKTEAAQKRRELLNQADAGTLNFESTMTTGAWMDHWLETIAQIAPLTKAGYRGYIDRYIIPSLGHIPLDKLKPEHLEALYTDLSNGTHPRTRKPVARATVRQTHSILRRALKIANQRERVNRNVALLVNPPRVPKAQTTALSLEDAHAIMAAAEHSPQRARWIIGLLLGLRPGEALGLTWDDIDFEANEIRVSKQLQYVAKRGLILKDSPKTDAGNRKVMMPVALAEILRAHRQAQLAMMVEEGPNWQPWEFDGKPVALVFTQRNGQPISSRLDTDYWEQLLADAGVPYTRRYTARHTAATLMLDQIGDVAVVAAALGHSDPSFTYRTYVHPMEEKKRQLADRMNNLVK